MLIAIGIVLIAAGVLVALFGDRTVSKNQGFVGKLFAWPVGRAKWLKIPMGLALIYAGVMLFMQR